ncbi:MAG: type II secretion system F family protein [Myxococcales bacterium]|nr:type II secretion system F family protein [Myxococcales bacterium]MDD9966651.1 type II secretion system F family protein [Myxococcales bacterium]
MSVPLHTLKWLALSCVVLSSVLLAYWSSQDSPVMRSLLARVEATDRRLRRLFLPPRGAHILGGQAACCVSSVGLWLLAADPRWLLAIPGCLAAPAIVLARIEKKRRQSIDEKADGFALSLANSLQATPSIGRALATVAETAPHPLDQELNLTLRELRVGSTLEQALGDFTARIGSAAIDATIAALLIGRRVGGNVPQILQDTGATLREMMRLAAVLRAKTADGRVQMIVLSLFPVALAMGFDALMPGYFDPLTESAVGVGLLVTAGVLWLSALLLARQILAVKL